MSDHEREAEVAMILARRSYMYALFHVAFGAEPSLETMRGLFSDDSADIVAAARDEAAAAGDSSAADGIGALDARLRGGAARRDDEGFAAELKSDYAKLFEIPGASYVHPWESPYLNGDNMVFQESTLDVRSFYHEAGLRLQAERRFPDDHVAAMMDFLAKTGQRAYDAFADGEDAEAARLFATARRFLDAHVITWADAFAREVAAHDARGVYGAFARGMAAFAHRDRALAEEIEKELSAAAE